MTTDAIGVTREGHRTFFKWHRARRGVTDPVFTGRRIVEGLATGASVEVDLVIHADRGFAVLHNLELGEESTGSGRVVDTPAAVLRTLHLRDNDGNVIPARVMLLEDLCSMLARTRLHSDSLLQLDYKEDAAALDAAAIRSFAESVAPVARHMILSSGDAPAVKLLTDATPGIRIGYDPCHGGTLDRLAETHDFAGFVRDAVAASPDAEMIYLEYELVLGAADLGFDLVAAFHAHNRRIDAYTLKRADEPSRETVERLLALKVDQITTDDAEGLAALLG